MNSAQLINQTSGDFEYYTPPHIVDAARRTMGGIDLDPASSPGANVSVRAIRYYDQLDNGLVQTWAGRVWLNHPFSRAHNAQWIYKLVDEYCKQRVEQACCITSGGSAGTYSAPPTGTNIASGVARQAAIGS